MLVTISREHNNRILSKAHGHALSPGGIVNLTRKMKGSAEVWRRKLLMGHGKWGVPMVMQLVLLQSLHSMFEIGPVKGYDIPQQPDDDVAVGNAQQWGRKQRENVGPVWLI